MTQALIALRMLQQSWNRAWNTLHWSVYCRVRVGCCCPLSSESLHLLDPLRSKSVIFRKHKLALSAFVLEQLAATHCFTTFVVLLAIYHTTSTVQRTYWSRTSVQPMMQILTTPPITEQAGRKENTEKKATYLACISTKKFRTNYVISLPHMQHFDIITKIFIFWVRVSL